MKKLALIVVVSCVISGLMPLCVGVASVRHDGAAVGRFSEKPGWPLILNVTVFGPPVVGDLDGDGAMEIVFGADDSLVYAVHANGTVAAHWPVYTGSESGDLPCIGDINNDGTAEVLAEGGRQLFALTPDGVCLPGWPVNQSTPVWLQRPAVADVDRDGVPDVLMSGADLYTFDGRQYVYNGSGSLLSGFPFQVNGTGFPGMSAVGDINGDGKKEIAIGTSHGLYEVDCHGSVLPGWPVDVNRSFTDPCTLADLDSDGKLELVGTTEGNWLSTVIYHHDGTKMAEIGNMTWYRKEVIAADLDGDHDLEVIGVSDGHVNAFHHNGLPVAGWPVSFTGEMSGVEGTGEPSLLAGDIDGDGSNEVLFCSHMNDTCRIYAWNGDGSLVAGFPFEGENHGIRSVQDGAMALADIDGDGFFELVCITSEDCSHHESVIHVFGLGIPVSQNPGWPQFHHDAAHTGASSGSDTLPPVVQIVYPTPGLYCMNKMVKPLSSRTVVIGPIGILVNASDNESGIARVVFFLDADVSPLHTDYTAPYTCNWTRPAFFKHTITVFAVDEAGNFADASIIIHKWF